MIYSHRSLEKCCFTAGQNHYTSRAFRANTLHKQFHSLSTVGTAGDMYTTSMPLVVSWGLFARRQYVWILFAKGINILITPDRTLACTLTHTGNHCAELAVVSQSAGGVAVLIATIYPKIYVDPRSCVFAYIKRSEWRSQCRWQQQRL